MGKRERERERERERKRKRRQKVLIGFCTRRTRCNLERDKERAKKSRRESRERLCPIPSSNPVSINPGKGKDNVRNGILASLLRKFVTLLLHRVIQ